MNLLKLASPSRSAPGPARAAAILTLAAVLLARAAAAAVDTPPFAEPEEFGGLSRGQAAPGYNIEDLTGKLGLGKELLGIRQAKVGKYVVAAVIDFDFFIHDSYTRLYIQLAIKAWLARSNYVKSSIIYQCVC